MNGKIQPKFCLLMGFPLMDYFDDEKNVQEKYALLLQQYKVPSVIIQNPGERYIHPQRLKNLLETLHVANTTIVEGYGGNQHNYNVECVKDVFLQLITNL